MSRVGSRVILHDPGPVLQGPAALRVLSAIGLGLAVAIGTEHPKVLQPVVVPDAVDVVDMDAERSASPFTKAAFLAAIFEQARLDKARLYVRTISPAHQQLFDRDNEVAARLDFAAEFGLVPGHRSKPEHYLSFAVRVRLVVGLNFGPVITSTAVFEWMVLCAQEPGRDRPDPSEMSHSEAPPTCKEAVALVVVTLDLGPVVNPFRHTPIVANMRSIVVAEMLPRPIFVQIEKTRERRTYSVSLFV
jgi:hypothetical protein